MLLATHTQGFPRSCSRQCMNTKALSHRHAAVRTRFLPRRPVVLRAAASDQSESTSACPFANVAPSQSNNGTKASPAAPLSSDIASLHGPGWTVLPNGNVNGSPQPEGDFCWNPILGDYGTFERMGAGAFLLKRYKKYGPVFTWKIGNETLVAITGYETIKSLLQNGDSKVITGWNPPALYAMLGEAAKKNLEDPAARALTRKLMAPGFSKEALRGYLDKIEAICRSQLEAWSAAGTAVDLITEGKALSFEFSTQLLVDFDVPIDQKPDMKRKLDALFQGMFAPPINLPGTRFNKGLKAKAELLQDVSNIIQQKSSEGGGTSGSSVFEYNLEARRRTMTTDGVLSDASMAEAGINLIIAGNDTSGLGMTALLAILPLFPEVIEKLRQEQQEVMSRHGSTLTVTALDSMPYADAVVREVLRVAPPSTQVMRQTLVDMEICGKFVPAGSKLYLTSLMGQVLTDPKLSPQLTPEILNQLGGSWYTLGADTLKQDFHPERWLQQSSSQSSSQSGSQAAKPSGLLTFSVGPHVCLGLSLYMHEAKVLLALLARGYTLSMEEPEGIGFNVGFVTQLKSQSRVRVGKLPAVAAAAPPAEPVAV